MGRYRKFSSSRWLFWEIGLAAALLLLSSSPAVGQITAPIITLTLSGSRFETGQTMTLGLAVQNPSGNPPADLFAGAVLPDGQTLVFLGPTGEVAGPVSLAMPAQFPAMQAAPPGFALDRPSLFQFTFPATGVPRGTYRAFAVLVRQGALQDNQIDPGDILAIDVKPFRFLLPIRGLYVQFERRGWAAEYWSGQVIQQFNDFDPVVGSSVAAEVALQLDVMRGMGVNTVTIELRTADPTFIPGGFVPPGCNLPPVLGFQWPQPTSPELTNLWALFDLIQQKGLRVLLRLVNTHMEEQPPTNSQTWLGAILGVVKDHPALELVLFEGDTHLIDTNGDGIPDACGIPAEPPLWLGPTAIPANYIRWAIGYALALGIPARKLSAEAVVGDFFVDSQPPAGPEATDRHLWRSIAVLKTIFDDLGILASQRTYALSFYEHRKCATARGLPCVDVDPHTWADQTLQSVLGTIGTGNGARVVAPEMGAQVPVDPAWQSDQALASLISLMEKYGIDGGSFWRWTSFENSEDVDPTLAQPVKRRGVDFIYNPVQSVIRQMY